jgi:hypothetical protein
MDKVVTEKLVQKKMDESDEIFEVCRNCQQSFLSKYWDHELEWYIDINLTSVCKECTDPLQEK